MKICPNCKAEIDDEFDLCWNCQYSFAERRVLGEKDFGLVCPACNSEIDANLQFCPYCKHDLNALFSQERQGVPGPVRNIDCLRCGTAMSFSGNFRFHEGSRMGALGDLFELTVNQESFDLYFCPSCGKVEFYLPHIQK